MAFHYDPMLERPFCTTVLSLDTNIAFMVQTLTTQWRGAVVELIERMAASVASIVLVA